MKKEKIGEEDLQVGASRPTTTAGEMRAAGEIAVAAAAAVGAGTLAVIAGAVVGREEAVIRVLSAGVTEMEGETLGVVTEAGITGTVGAAPPGEVVVVVGAAVEADVPTPGKMLRC